MSRATAMNRTMNSSAQKISRREKGAGWKKKVTAIIRVMPAAVAVPARATSSSHELPRRRHTPVVW